MKPEPNYRMDRPDVISCATTIRLPGIPGPVSWLARIDLDMKKLKTLEIGLPNDVTDTLVFDQVKGVQVYRQVGEEQVPLTVPLTRQILGNARIISGLHLQLAIEQVFGHA